MKTTIDIADDLITRARLVQKRDDVTLRALVEEGLRIVLDRRAVKMRYKFEPVTVGERWKPGMLTADVNALVAECNDRVWKQREFGSPVQEGREAYRMTVKRGSARKRR